MGDWIFVGIRLRWEFRSQSLGPTFDLACLFYLLCPSSLVALGQSHCSISFTMLSKIPKCSENSPICHWWYPEGQKANLRGNSLGFMSVLGVLWKHQGKPFTVKWPAGEAKHMPATREASLCFLMLLNFQRQGQAFFLASGWPVCSCIIFVECLFKIQFLTNTGSISLIVPGILFVK